MQGGAEKIKVEPKKLRGNGKTLGSRPKTTGGRLKE
jgi:hypothetical protein